MNGLKEFFDEERMRVYEPSAFFTQRVMARLNERTTQESGVWEFIPVSTRPVLAIALMLILCFVAVETFIPQMPQRGIVESFLEPDQNPAESFLYSGADVPSRQDVLEQLIAPTGAEDQQ
jgi:hypothetical protein